MQAASGYAPTKVLLLIRANHRSVPNITFSHYLLLVSVLLEIVPLTLAVSEHQRVDFPEVVSFPALRRGSDQ